MLKQLYNDLTLFAWGGIRTGRGIEILLFAFATAAILVVTYNIIMRLMIKTGKVNYVEVKAMVVAIEKKKAVGPRAGDTMVYRPTFQYEWKGFKRTVESRAWTNVIKFKIGDEVDLLIDPDNGSNYRYKNGFMDPMNMMGFVFLFIFIASILAWV